MPLDWAIGDLCTAIYSEDSSGYTVEIKDINQDELGSSYAVVEFQGYGNVETVWLEDLLPPPLPENGFTVGGYGRISSDNQEYEVEIMAMDVLKASVRVIGREKVESVLLNELMGSRGPSARQTQEAVLSDGNNNINKSHDSNSMNVTLHPDNSSVKEEKYNLTLQPIDSDQSYVEPVKEDVRNTTIFPETAASPPGILKVSKEIDSKLVLIDSLSETKSAFETLAQKHAKLEIEYMKLQAVFDEECVKSSSLEDEKKLLRNQIEKTKSLYSDENLDLKKRLKEMLDRQKAWDLEKNNLETRILCLSNEINKLSNTADDTVLSYREKIQQLEFELNELRLTSKEKGENTSGGSDTKNVNNNSMNTTISLDRDDSVSLMQSPLRGNHPIVSLSHESERNYTNLLHGGPVSMGQFQLQPVLCYFPVLGTHPQNMMPQTLNNVQSPTSPFRGSMRTANGGGLRELRRPLPMTEFRSRCPNSEGRINVICMESNGSTALVKELEDPNTTVPRITQICDELKGYLSNICKDKWGHQVVLSLLSVSSYVSCHELITEVWESFTSIMESTYGLSVILDTLKRIPANEKFAIMVERAVINHGILSLMLIEGGNHIINSVIDRFKPHYILDCVNKNVLKLALNEHGNRVLSKALAVYPHDKVIPAVEYVINNVELVEKDSPHGLSIFEAILENHRTGGIAEDNCLRTMSTSLSPNFKMVLNRMLESAPLGSSPLK